MVVNYSFILFMLLLLSTSCHASALRNSESGEDGSSDAMSANSYVWMYLDGENRKVPQCQLTRGWGGHQVYKMYNVDCSAYPLFFDPSKKQSPRDWMHAINVSKVDAEPDYTFDAEMTLHQGYVINHQGYVYRTNIPYAYRADERHILSIWQAYAAQEAHQSQKNPMASVEFCEGSLLDASHKMVLVGSRTAEGAYLFATDEEKQNFTIYRINTLGLPVASLEENVEHAPHMFLHYARKDDIFDGSYAAGWDEVHIGGPIGLDRLAVVAECGTHMGASRRLSIEGIPSMQNAFSQQLPKRKANMVGKYLNALV